MAPERQVDIGEIKHPEIASLLEPVIPREFLPLTSNFAAALGKLSDMGYRTTKGDVLVQHNGLLRWICPNGDIGYGQEIVYGWNAVDETAQLTAELLVKGRKPRNPRSLRLEIPGFPQSSIKISTSNFRSEDTNLTIIYDQHGNDMSHSEISINSFSLDMGSYTGINCWKRTRGFQREVSFHYLNREWNLLHLTQTALVKLEVFDAVTLLSHEITELYRSKHASDEVREMLTKRINRSALGLKQLIKSTSLKDEELQTYGAWIKDEEPEKYSALFTILKASGMNPREIERCIVAVQSGTDRVPSPLGRLGAKFKTRKSSGSRKITRFLPPKLDDRDIGQAGALTDQWRKHSADFVKEHFDDYILLENELAGIIFPLLPGIRILMKNGIRFKFDEKPADTNQK